MKYKSDDVDLTSLTAYQPSDLTYLTLLIGWPAYLKPPYRGSYSYTPNKSNGRWLGQDTLYTNST